MYDDVMILPTSLLDLEDINNTFTVFTQPHAEHG